MPHHDTLNRLLSRIEVEKIEEAPVELVKDLLRNKKFQRYLRDQQYLIAIDGTQKFSRDACWAEECQERHVGGGEGEKETQYYVYVLEAVLIFANGMALPLLSEFLRYPDGDVETAKQDCELKAFKRLVPRLKKHFPRLPVVAVLDGLYPNGPVLTLCRRFHWQYMIVLQDSNSASSQSLPSVWEVGEFRGHAGPEVGGPSAALLVGESHRVRLRKRGETHHGKGARGGMRGDLGSRRCENEQDCRATLPSCVVVQ